MSSFTLSEAVRGSEDQRLACTLEPQPRAIAGAATNPMTRYLSICMPASPSQTRVWGGGVDHYHLIFLLDIRLNRQGMMTSNQTVGSVMKRRGGETGSCSAALSMVISAAAAKRQDAQLQQSEVFDSRPGRRRPFLEPLTTLRKRIRSEYATHQAKDSFFFRRNRGYEFTVGKVKHCPARSEVAHTADQLVLGRGTEEVIDGWLNPPSMKL